MSIRYLNALAGAGKTRALVRYADRMACRGRKVLFVQPSKLLINQSVANELRLLGPSYPVTTIHGDVTNAVVATLAAHFKNAKPGGEIVFATHAALMRLPYVHKAKDWLLIVDEVPAVDIFQELRLPETHSLLTDHVACTPEGAKYGRLEAKEGAGRLRDIARNSHGDEVFDVLGDLAYRLTSEDWSVFCLCSAFESLLAGDKANGRLTTHSLLRPSVFQKFDSTIIASACFEDTMLYHLWASQGVPMKPIKKGPLIEDLRYHQHPNGELIKIAYVSDEDWSKSLRDRSVEVDGETLPLLSRLIGITDEVMGDDPIAWMGNKDLPDTLFQHLPGAVRLPNCPHGLNTYQHLNRVVVLSALNPPPAHFSFMESRGISGDQLRTGHYRTAVYQATMRTGPRDPSNKEPKLVVVMDRDTAYWLADLFPGSEVMPMSGLGGLLKKGKPGRTRLHATTADRKRAYREREKTKLFGDVAAINGSGIRPLTYRGLCSENEAGFGQKTRDENTFIRTFCPTNFGSALASKYATRPFHYLDLTEDDEFIGLLRSLHDEVAESKEDNFLLSPACFDSDMPGTATKRGLANITHVRGIWMDNDGGDLTHEKFAQLFPYLRIVVWSTYSSTPENPRWRAFIPTSYAMSVEVHRCVMAQIEKVLKDAGYRSQKDIEQLKGKSRKAWFCHGFDTSKFNAASLFYAPCQAAHPQGSFFVDYDEAKRAPLDLCDWLDNCILNLSPEPEPETAPVVVEPAPSSHPEGLSEGLTALRQKLAEMKARSVASSKQSRIDKAIDTWRSAPRGSGHDAFYRLAVALKHAGLGDGQIRERLSAEAYHAHSPSDRRGEIRSIMRSLCRVGTFYSRGVA